MALPINGTRLNEGTGEKLEPASPDAVKRTADGLKLERNQVMTSKVTHSSQPEM